MDNDDHDDGMGYDNRYENRMPESAPWWFSFVLIGTPTALGLVGWGYDVFHLILLSSAALMLIAGAGIAINTAFKNRTGYDLSDNGSFDALWQIFIVQRRSRQKR